MRRCPFHLVNVFVDGDSRLSGNALAVFPDAQGLPDATMQALALQLNLAETTFVTSAAGTEPPLVRIFTPTREMPFAGHPTLGTAAVLRQLGRAGDELMLGLVAGRTAVTARGARHRLRAPLPPSARPLDLPDAGLADVLGLGAGEVLPGSQWVNTGTEQLVVPLSDAAAVGRARPDPTKFHRVGTGTRGEPCAYVFAPDGADRLVARFFYSAHGAVIEDPATGSACANLGGWLALRGARAIARDVRQGERVGRPSRLFLEVSDDGATFVAGDVTHVGTGHVDVD